MRRSSLFLVPVCLAFVTPAVAQWPPATITGPVAVGVP